MRTNLSQPGLEPWTFRSEGQSGFHYTMELVESLEKKIHEFNKLIYIWKIHSFLMANICKNQHPQLSDYLTLMRVKIA